MTWLLAHDHVILRVYTKDTLDGEVAKCSDTRALCLLLSLGLWGHMTYMRYDAVATIVMVLERLKFLGRRQEPRSSQEFLLKEGKHAGG